MTTQGADQQDALLLVDYENVQKLDLRAIPEGVRVRIFVGSQQKAIPIAMVEQAQALGPRLEWVRCENIAPNALDFMIACSLGREIERAPEVSYTILSKDHGFDPLLKHLRDQGLKCRRINSQTELEATKPPQETAEFRKVMEILRRSAKNARPRKRETLAKHIANMLHQKVESDTVADVLDLMFRQGLVTEAAGTVSYSF